jgi:hypothetical protein
MDLPMARRAINRSALFSEQSKTHHETNYQNGITLLSPLSISFIRYTSLQQIVLSADNQEYILSASPIFGATESERLRFIPFHFNSTAHLSLIMSAAY